MTRRMKQRPGDEELLYDESADSVERASALMRLASDGRTDLVEVARAWLKHADGMLRSEAANMLLSFWRLESELEATIALLHEDAEHDVRSMAAHALSTFLERTQRHRDRILCALVRQLEHDSHWIVQRACYEELLKHLDRERAQTELPYRFVRERDVDWVILAPWRQ